MEIRINTTFPPKHGFIEDAVLPISCKSGKFPQENQVKRMWLSFWHQRSSVKSRTFACISSADPFVQIDVSRGSSSM